MAAVCKDHADLKIARVIPPCRSKFDFPIAVFPLSRSAGLGANPCPALRDRENPPSPPCRPEPPCDWTQCATVQTASPPSTRPNHWPHPPEQPLRQRRLPLRPA